MSTGQHLIADIQGVSNLDVLHSLPKLMHMMDEICKKYDYHVLHRAHHCFTPQGITILYLLSESHFSIHTYPEHGYVAIDLYTCRKYPDDTVYRTIYEAMRSELGASGGKCTIIDRSIRSCAAV